MVWGHFGLLFWVRATYLTLTSPTGERVLISLEPNHPIPPSLLGLQRGLPRRQRHGLRPVLAGRLGALGAAVFLPQGPEREVEFMFGPLK